MNCWIRKLNSFFFFLKVKTSSVESPCLEFTLHNDTFMEEQRSYEMLAEVVFCLSEQGRYVCNYFYCCGTAGRIRFDCQLGSLTIDSYL